MDQQHGGGPPAQEVNDFVALAHVDDVFREVRGGLLEARAEAGVLGDDSLYICAVVRRACVVVVRVFALGH